MIDLERELENEFKELCDVCEGSGGWDISTDCEVYDHWVECQVCEGEGYLDILVEN